MSVRDAYSGKLNVFDYGCLPCSSGTKFRKEAELDVASVQFMCP